MLIHPCSPSPCPKRGPDARDWQGVSLVASQVGAERNTRRERHQHAERDHEQDARRLASQVRYCCANKTDGVPVGMVLATNAASTMAPDRPVSLMIRKNRAG